MEEETNYVKNLSKGIIITTKPDEITLKAMKKQKVKVVEEEPSSEDEEEESSLDDKEMEFFIWSFKKIMKDHMVKQEKTYKSRSE